MLAALDVPEGARRFSIPQYDQPRNSCPGGNSMRRTSGNWIPAGLAALGVLFAGGREAQAGGIVITTATTEQTGDPTFKYIFTVELLAGSTLNNGGFFTVYDLPGIPATALTSAPNISWGASIQLTGIDPPGLKPPDDPAIYNVTWQWNGSSPIFPPPTSDTPLGTFVVGSTTELPSPPTPTLTYAYFLNDGPPATTGMNTIQVTVPEPSSVILMLAGVGALPLAWLHRRRLGRRVASP
jgi:hypothetical protein